MRDFLPGHFSSQPLGVQSRVQCLCIPPEDLIFSRFSQTEALGVSFFKARDKTLRRPAEPAQHLKDAIPLACRFGLESCNA
jgi:hypothetical protein